MARLPRIVVPGQPLHIMHRGNNRQNIFESDEDMFRIREDISVSLKKAACTLHAYVIMTNHLLAIRGEVVVQFWLRPGGEVVELGFSGGRSGSTPRVLEGMF